MWRELGSRVASFYSSVIEAQGPGFLWGSSTVTYGSELGPRSRRNATVVGLLILIWSGLNPAEIRGFSGGGPGCMRRGWEVERFIENVLALFHQTPGR